MTAPEAEGPDSDLRTRLAGFLNEFYRDTGPVSQRARLEDEPALTSDERFDAYIGAAAEHLCRRWLLGAPPAWVEDPLRFLKRPWFLGGERMKPILLRESPSAFRRRLIFTESEPLRRATMPRDGRWWYYEGMRTGMKPEPGDVAPSRTVSSAS